jgi:peptidoglycan/xylan/chitin deacetylase (PgdA/CDA1 family)
VRRGAVPPPNLTRARWHLHLLVLLVPLLAVWHADAPPAAAPALPEPMPAAAPATEPIAPEPVAIAYAEPAGPPIPPPLTDGPCPPAPTGPLPDDDDPAMRDFWAAFKAPLPPTPVWAPPGQPRVGLQVGHWQYAQRAHDLFYLDPGGQVDGVWEWEVGLDLAQRAQRMLEAAGVQADVLDMTIPERYRANAFLSIHADTARALGRRGFKLARPGFSSIPDVDDRFVAALGDTYAGTTGLPRDDRNVGDGMRYYYGFNPRRYCHAVAPGVPQAILETGYLSSAEDREVILDDPDIAARGIADGVLRFLGLKPPEAVAHGPRRVPAGQDEVLGGDPTRHDVALAIDVGAGYEPATSVLDTLRDKHVQATFFVMGAWAEAHSNLLTRIAGEGHEIGSHGYRLADPVAASDEEVRSDLETGDTAIAHLTGRSTRPLWNPAGGSSDDRVRAIAASLGYRTIVGSVDSGDWQSSATADQVYQRVLSGVTNGSIIILHLDGATATTSTAAALPRLIDRLQANGYHLETVTDLLT